MNAEVTFLAVWVCFACWAIWGASQEGGLIAPIVERFKLLQSAIVTSCPKCMPTLYTIPVAAYAWYATGNIHYLWAIPIAWLVASGINALIIEIKD